jgi:hypothetical protein
METPKALEQDWPFLLTLLPPNLEATAKAMGALQRKRGVASAEALLRLAFAYAYCGLSLRGVVTWAREAQVAHLSEVALLKRLRHAAAWFGHLLAQMLAHRTALRPESLPEDLRLYLVDATSVSRPGSTGTDFRLHLKLDLGRLAIEQVTLTGVDGGESLKQYEVAPGDLLVGDRGHAHRQGIAAVVAAGGHVIVRLTWHNMPLQQRDGRPFDLLAVLGGLGPTQIGEWEVQSAPATDGTPAVPGRLVAIRKSPQAAEATRRKLLAAARKKGKTPDARSLEAAGYLFLFTTVSPQRLAAGQVLEVYRFRWQIELAFKRMKSVLQLDALAAKEEQFCQTFLCVKVLGALLVEELSHRWVAFSPWGYGSGAASLAVAGVSGGGRNDPPGGGSRPHGRPVGRRKISPGASVSRSATPTSEPSRKCHLLYPMPDNR